MALYQGNHPWRIDQFLTVRMRDHAVTQDQGVQAQKEDTGYLNEWFQVEIDLGPEEFPSLTVELLSCKNRMILWI